MPFVNTSMYVHQGIQISAAPHESNIENGVVPIEFSSPADRSTFATLSLDLTKAMELKHVLIVEIRRRVVANVSRQMNEWASGKRWVRRVVVWGFGHDEVNAYVDIDPMPENWTTRARCDRIAEVSGIGLAVGASIYASVRGICHEGDSDVMNKETAGMDRSDEFFTLAYERKDTE